MGEIKTGKTEREVELAYRAARRIARSFVSRYNGVLPPSLDFEDYVQEGILAWLEGRDMYWEMNVAFKKASKLSVYAYKVKKTPVPQSVEFEDDKNQEDRCAELECRVDAGKITERVYAIQDEKVQFAIMAYLLLGMSLREIGKVFEKSHEWVRTYLIEPELHKMREEFK